VREGRIWTAKDDPATLPTWLGIPGLRHTIGLAGWWHFSIDLLWIINGVAFYVLDEGLGETFPASDPVAVSFRDDPIYGEQRGRPRCQRDAGWLR
jgi:hypothetical protein